MSFQCFNDIYLFIFCTENEILINKINKIDDINIVTIKLFEIKKNNICDKNVLKVYNKFNNILSNNIIHGLFLIMKVLLFCITQIKSLLNNPYSDEIFNFWSFFIFNQLNKGFNDLSLCEIGFIYGLFNIFNNNNQYCLLLKKNFFVMYTIKKQKKIYIIRV